MQTKDKLDTFISSAQKEFGSIREELEQKISQMPYLNCILLEKRGAQPWNTTDASIKAASSCDIYIGIFGEKYSTITVKEYKRAHVDLKPIFVYVMNAEKREPNLQRFIDLDLRRITTNMKDLMAETIFVIK